MTKLTTSLPQIHTQKPQDDRFFLAVAFNLSSKYERISIYSKRSILMDRGKVIAIITGVISLIIAVAYLVIVQVLDFRGEMIPAPVSQIINLTDILGYIF